MQEICGDGGTFHRRPRKSEEAEGPSVGVRRGGGLGGIGFRVGGKGKEGGFGIRVVGFDGFLGGFQKKAEISGSNLLTGA